MTDQVTFKAAIATAWCAANGYSYKLLGAENFKLPKTALEAIIDKLASEGRYRPFEGSEDVDNICSECKGEMTGPGHEDGMCAECRRKNAEKDPTEK